MLAAILFAAAAAAATDTTPIECGNCAAWNKPHAAIQLHANSWYVGTDGLSAVAIVTPEGLVVIDGALPQSAELIVRNIESFGYEASDIRGLLNSHPHFDHAGGLAALQRLSGASVVSSARGAEALRAGNVPEDDAQHGYGAAANAFPPIADVVVLQDGETLSLGELELTMHATPGHTPGGTTWSWRSCTDRTDECLTIVYADSVSAVSSDDFEFSADPDRLAQFEATFAKLESLECDLVVSAHPSVSNLFEKVAARDNGADTPALFDPLSCKAYAQVGRDFLAQRLADEAADKAD
jgi:metallo-beta-lactamase class B